MIFGKKKHWDEYYDEGYAAKTERLRKLSAAAVWLRLAGFFVIVGLALGAVGIFFGKTMVEKLLTAMVAPLGLVWMLLLFHTYTALLFRQGWFALLSLASWLVITVFGNNYVANQLAYSLEAPHIKTTLVDLPKMDTVFLLGGGTSTTLLGSALGNQSGDRVLTAARLYHLGKVNMIVCTGEQSFRTVPEDLDPREEAYRLLLALDVPAENVAMIRGKNTTEEMQNALAFLEQQEMTDAKIGLVTSAWHLSRAGRLAQKNGLDPVLVPADFSSHHFTSGPDLFLPEAIHLGTSACCVKEYLAGLIGR